MDRALALALHLELRRFVTCVGTRRTADPVCHVGHPAGEHARIPDRRADDAGLRADLVERALDGLETTRRACVWLTRTGTLGRTDHDAHWFAAARSGFAGHGLPLPGFFVLNRTGWVDLVTEETRTWSRVRPLSRGTGPD